MNAFLSGKLASDLPSDRFALLRTCASRACSSVQLFSSFHAVGTGRCDGSGLFPALFLVDSDAVFAAASSSLGGALARLTAIWNCTDSFCRSVSLIVDETTRT